MMSRRLAREAAMCLLFEYAVMGEMNEKTLDVMDDIFSPQNINETNRQYISKIIEQMLLNNIEIDSKIEKFSYAWKVSRMSKVDLSILRLAIIEILYFNDIPYKVSVNEAVELAKKYSSDKSPKFINGLLGSLIKEIEPS